MDCQGQQRASLTHLGLVEATPVNAGQRVSRTLVARLAEAMSDGLDRCTDLYVVGPMLFYGFGNPSRCPAGSLD